MAEQVDTDVDVEDYANDADAWLSGIGAPDFHQRGPDLDRQPAFNPGDVAWGQAPDWSFREYPFEGNQGAPAHDWSQYDYHSGYGVNSGRDRANGLGRWHPYSRQPARPWGENPRGMSLAELASRPQRRVTDVPGVYSAAARGGQMAHYRPLIPRQPMFNVPAQLETAYQFPTRFGGRFARAMSAIAINPETGAPGTGIQENYTDDNFRREVSQALAIKLNLKTRHHANEKMLHELVRSGGKCSTLKQAVQARSAVYDE